MTILEETIFDSGTGRIANATFADYLIPVNADVPDLDVVFVGRPDEFTPLGLKGLGEIGTVGVSAAIANAVYHATGKRIRSLPITIEHLLEHPSESLADGLDRRKSPALAASRRRVAASPRQLLHSGRAEQQVPSSCRRWVRRPEFDGAAVGSVWVSGIWGRRPGR
jgi:xanthine dehydrogenase YagR molybdenum-binding subunit